MRFLFLGLVVLLSSQNTFSQERNDIGVLAGSSYYMGDFNLSTQFYQPSPAIGVLFRHNLNEFYSLKLSGTHGNLKGYYNPNNQYLPQIPYQSFEQSFRAFDKRLVEISGAIEIGLRPFGTKPVDANSISPYVTLGVSLAIIDRDLLVNIPFGVGVKYTPFNRWTFGAEWRLHKTFNDNIDYYPTHPNQSFRIHNFDWVGIGGLFVSYRLVNKGAICPAYD
ncbi:MAG: DUF6089 family protein [Tenuifilaceae bacterium]|jgi:hypothetical protein|nr:DUF6089 family protein [Tenuifilaceae bacterium]